MPAADESEPSCAFSCTALEFLNIVSFPAGSISQDSLCFIGGGGPQSKRMEKPFHEISTISTVQGIFLVSEQGEVLFESDQRWLSAEDGFIRMRRTVRSLSLTEKSVFYFDNGSLYVVKTDLGYLLVSREGAVFDLLVTDACNAVIGRLAEQDSRKRLLLYLLAQSRPALKPQIVKALVPYGDIEVARELVRLLPEGRSSNLEVRNRLLLHVCQALGYHPFEFVLHALKDFLKNPGKVNDAVLGSASVAVEQIEMALPEKQRVQAVSHPAAPSGANRPGSGKDDNQPITDLPEERRVLEYLSAGENQKGRQLLREMITATARKRRFKEAEKLREWLIRIDPMALSDIIAAAEIIENEKTAAINKDHLAVWTSLRDSLDSEGYSTFYHSLEHKHYASGEMVVRQGSQQSSLYFVNSGRVELFFQEKGKEIKVKTIGAGEVLGAGTFFETSVWTVSARSLGADLSRLKIDTMQQWQADYPALEGKLNDFCMRFKIPVEAFKKTGQDRREYERYRLEGRISMALLDRDGKEVGVGAKGDLFDISAGGVAFFLRISQKKNARLLFGRKVRLAISSKTSFSITGEIVAVRSQPVVGNEYSVHVCFSQVLDEGKVHALISS